MKKVYLFLAEGFEEIEALCPVDLLRRAGAQCVMVSVTGSMDVTGAHGITVKADKLFEEEDCLEADCIVLPGGSPGTNHLKAHEGLKRVIKEFDKRQKLIAAICAAPTILGEMGLLEGRHAVCYPGLEDKLLGAVVEHWMCWNDGHILTSRGAGTAMQFGFKIIELLLGDWAMDQIKNSVVF